MNNNTTIYYKEVGNYFDIFAKKHHDKSDTNIILTEMRDSFRTYVTHADPKNILDIGCGPGMDAAFFAQKYPKATVYGVDVSAGMIGCAEQLCISNGIRNARFLNTGIEKIHEHLPTDVRFDVIYVFFGALNTVSSLKDAATKIDALLAPGGQVVLTFVNKYFLSEFFIHALKLQPKKAFARWGKTWRGYSNDYRLESKTYTPSYIRRTFSNTGLQLRDKKGYCIFYPAWFQVGWLKKYPALCSRLKKLDKWLDKAPWIWSKGEYTLFVYNKP